MLKETDRETKHIIETLVGFKNGIENNRSALDKECSHIENEIALEKSKAIGRLNELEKSLKTKLHRLKDKNEVIMTDELGKIKDINSQAKKRLQQIQLVEKHGTDRQAFLLAYELRKILPETEKSITDLSMTNKIIRLHFKGNKGIETSISTLGEITEMRKENGMLSYCQLKQQQAKLSVVKEKIPMDNFQVSHRYKVNCSNVLGMIATDDGGLLLCDYSEKKGGVVVYGQNGKYINLLTEFPFSISTNQFCDQHCKIQIEYFCTHHDVILCRACLADGHRSCKDVVVLDIACAGSKTTVLKETDRETKHIIETLAAFEIGIENYTKNAVRSKMK